MLQQQLKYKPKTWMMKKGKIELNIMDEELVSDDVKDKMNMLYFLELLPNLLTAKVQRKCGA